ncbi:SusC/RagA family TonB-linked outer membrane protein [Flavicella sediminum]|uniref:SusC/RagA family TonB-linked outer membrane protein n=1 Tax=Flavicella sediminum TaxID=2585141 RepID=UPI001120782B|nr:TonB-dependent receptor [Flavicella sediminum]
MKKKLQLKLFSKGSMILLFFMVLTLPKLQAQQTTIKGVVTDESNQPLPGANLVIKGTQTGTQTDFDGNFSVTANKNAILIVSYVGYENKEVVITGKSGLKIQLAPTSNLMDEVVIVGYGSQKKSDLTGSIASIDSKDIDKYTYNDASQALQGKMAGVNVQAQGGAPGAGSVITIRGTGTFSNAGPLFIIDGMITGNMNTVNPGDIANVSVLKDASATAIYGSRAANGVVIITTKKGKKGKVTIDLDTSYGVQKAINQVDWADATQYATIVNRANDADGVPRYPANDSQFDPNYSSNLYDDSFRTASVRNTNLRFSGGGENSVYSLSLNQFEQEGIIKFSDFERTTVRLNAGLDKGKFKMESTIGLTRTVNSPNTFFNQERNLLPTIRLKDENGNWNSDDREARGITTAYGAFYGPGTIRNELGYAALIKNKIKQHTVLGNISASYEILDGLTYKLNLGLETSSRNNFRFSPDNQLIYNGGNSATSELSESNTNSLNTLVENTLNYKKSFGKHTIDFIAGFTDQKNNSRSLGINAINAINGISVAGAFDSKKLQGAPSVDITSGIQSYFGRLNYNYNDKYLLTASMRRDGSSVFREPLRFGKFPSFALGWNLSNEDFMEDFNALTNIKLRGGYGQVGSNNVPAYQIIPTINLFSTYILGDDQNRTAGYAITRGVNTDVFWETTTTTNLGLEFNALNSKLSVTMDYFIKDSEDILVNVQRPFYIGTSNTVPENRGDIRNKGFEFLATYRDQIGDLNFSVTGNFSTLDNVVKSLGGQAPIIGGGFTSNGLRGTRTEIGQPIGSFYGYVTDGIYQTDAEATAANDQEGNPKAGDLKFKDFDGNGLDPDDRRFLGSAIPNFEYGININADYKNFDLSLFFNGVSGNKILNSTIYRGYFDFNGNYLADAANAWTPSNTNTNVPRNTQVDPGFNRRMSDFYLESGAYFRLRNAQIGYTIPDTIIDKIKIEKIRFYLSGTNLFTLNSYSGYYPEVGTNGRGGTSLFNRGVDEGNYPTPRTFQLGLQVSF